jgi:CheY-like chemotaxis protein
LRTPLNAIIGFGQILMMRAQDLDPQQQDNIQQILKAGHHLLDLINEVLDIARIEAGHLSLSPEPLLIQPLVQEVFNLVRPLAMDRHIELINQVGLEIGEPTVLADQQRLKQVLLNLVSNAVKYNCDGGKVVISSVSFSGEPTKHGAVKCCGFLRVLVRDTGRGLSQSDLDCLFVPFERLGAARTQIEGTGIGLSLCKRLTEAMDGRVGVESRVGEGSTFWVELPLVIEPALSGLINDTSVPVLGIAQDKTPSDEAFVAAPLRSSPTTDTDGIHTILHIEDNLSNVVLIEHMLSELHPNIRLLTAMQGSLGLDLAVQHLPDLILLDVNLPDIMGDVVLRRLKANPLTAPIPVVVLSADATPRQIEQMRKAGSSHYLTKPLDVSRFLDVLTETLHKSTS